MHCGCCLKACYGEEYRVHAGIVMACYALDGKRPGFACRCGGSHSYQNQFDGKMDHQCCRGPYAGESVCERVPDQLGGAKTNPYGGPLRDQLGGPSPNEYDCG